jgi:hypothetical protein
MKEQGGRSMAALDVCDAAERSLQQLAAGEELNVHSGSEPRRRMMRW